MRQSLKQRVPAPVAKHALPATQPFERSQGAPTGVVPEGMHSAR
jgi:hypothetical protein